MQNIRVIFLITIIMLSISGCSVYSKVSGYNYDMARIAFWTGDLEVSKKTPIKLEKDKSYVIFDGRTIVYEDVNNIVKLAGYIEEAPGVIVLEVNPGKHTYVNFASCDPYTVTVDVKKGYAYNIGYSSIGKPNLMSYCRGQSVFRSQKILGINKHGYYNNYTLLEENIKKANEIVQDSGIQSRYDDFRADIDDKRAYMKLQLRAEEGILIQ